MRHQLCTFLDQETTPCCIFWFEQWCHFLFMYAYAPAFTAMSSIGVASDSIQVAALVACVIVFVMAFLDFAAYAAWQLSVGSDIISSAIIDIDVVYAFVTSDFVEFAFITFVFDFQVAGFLPTLAFAAFVDSVVVPLLVLLSLSFLLLLFLLLS